MISAVKIQNNTGYDLAAIADLIAVSKTDGLFLYLVFNFGEENEVRIESKDPVNQNLFGKLEISMTNVFSQPRYWLYKINAAIASSLIENISTLAVDRNEDGVITFNVAFVNTSTILQFSTGITILWDNKVLK